MAFLLETMWSTKNGKFKAKFKFVEMLPSDLTIYFWTESANGIPLCWINFYFYVWWFFFTSTFFFKPCEIHMAPNNYLKYFFRKINLWAHYWVLRSAMTILVCGLRATSVCQYFPATRNYFTGPDIVQPKGKSDLDQYQTIIFVEFVMSRFHSYWPPIFSDVDAP